MVHVQIIPRDGANLQTLIRQAIADERIRSFSVSQVRGGLRIKHKKHLGEIRFTKSKGPCIATVICKNSSKEWQVLEAFVGRMAYHFRNEIAAINLQMERP